MLFSVVGNWRLWASSSCQLTCCFVSDERDKFFAEDPDWRCKLVISLCSSAAFLARNGEIREQVGRFFFFFRKFYRHCNQRGILQCFFRRQRKTCLRLKTKPGQIWTVGRLCILVLEQGNLIKRSAETSERNCVHAVFDPMRMLENSDLWHLYLMPCL